MRKALVFVILSGMAVTAFGSAQSSIAVNPKTASVGLPVVHDNAIAPTDTGGPPGADEIKYDDGAPPSQGWCFYDRRSKYAVRMDPAYYPAIVAQCDFCICPQWPFRHHDSIYVQIWFDLNGDSVPDFPAVWSAWAQGRDSTPDSTAVTVPVPLGQVICCSGSFWVSMMADTANAGAGREVVASDSVSNYPDHQFYYYLPDGVWRRGIYIYDMDFMIRSWTIQQGVLGIVAEILSPVGTIFVGDTATPSVHVENLGTGPDSAWLWMRIEDTSSTDDYVDSFWIRINPLQTLDTTYRPWSPLYAGVYRMQCTTERNDTTWTYLTVLAREGMEAGVLPLRFTGEGLEVGPNPVRTAAAIRYSVTGKSRVVLRILDVRGRVVRTLVAGCSPPGEHVAVWDTHDDHGRPTARGIYFVRLESQERPETRKVILAR